MKSFLDATISISTLSKWNHRSWWIFYTRIDNICFFTQYYIYSSNYCRWEGGPLKGFFLSSLKFLLWIEDHFNILFNEYFSIQEYMIIMGLSRWIHWLSFFIVSYAKLLLMVVVITILLHIVTIKSDPTVVFVFFLLYSFDAVYFSFVLSTFLQSGKYCSGYYSHQLLLLLLVILILLLIISVTALTISNAL